MPDGNLAGPAQMTGPSGFLSTAHRLVANGMNVSALRTNALLREDEWKVIDEAVVQVARGRLTAIADLQNAGLTRDLGGLGVLIDEYEKVGDMTDAEQSMAGVSEGEEDIASFSITGVPVPITHKDFRVNIRHLEASRTRGASIDTTSAEIASRKVSEKLEDMLFNGGDVTIGSDSIPGYTTFSDRGTHTFADGDAWTAAAKTGEEILDDVIEMIGVAEGDNFFGNFVLYVPQSYMKPLRDDFKTNSDKTTMQRILELDVVQAIRASSKLTGDNVLLVQLSREVVDLSVGQDITTVEWEQKGGLQVRFKVMAAMAPRLKSDSNGNTGIVHGTPT